MNFTLSWLSLFKLFISSIFILVDREKNIDFFFSSHVEYLGRSPVSLKRGNITIVNINAFSYLIAEIFFILTVIIKTKNRNTWYCKSHVLSSIEKRVFLPIMSDDLIHVASRKIGDRRSCLEHPGSNLIHHGKVQIFVFVNGSKSKLKHSCFISS